jgi:FlaA1/EpsC-like NDP-sugar epimerase/lipopolysaccharide/colanic/teichoic acid biosynthesis glycosyltransferase
MKRAFDILFSVFGLIVGAPIFLLVSILIKIDSQGRVFFLQHRVGKHGKIFRVIKFRTMVKNAAEVGPRLTAKNDPRITVIGQILRWLKIDELPQLLNVLRGQMSIIGPRPEIPSIVDLYTAKQRDVLSVKPGMLGPSQIVGRDELEKYPDDVDVEAYYIEHILPEKLATDLEYVKNASFLNDIRYLFRGLHKTLIGSIKVKYIVESRRRIFTLGLDTLFACLSYVIAYSLRFDWGIPLSEYRSLLKVLPFIVVLRPAIFVYFGLYQSVWKYLDVKDITNVVKAVSLSTVLIAFFAYLAGTTGHPRSVFIVDWFLLVTFMSGFRLFFRFQLANGTARNGKLKNVLIVGAGDTGESLVREILKNPDLGYRPVGFIDDDTKKKGMFIHGLKILGRSYDMSQIVQLKNVDELIVAISRATSGEMHRIVGFCEKARVKYRIVPSVSDLISGKVHISKIRNVEVSDLLGRETLKLDLSAIRKLIAGKATLLAGGAGSIGAELCRQILPLGPACLVIVDKGENALWSLKWELARSFPNSEIHYYLRDITERPRLREIFREHRPRIVFQCAGLNHTSVVEGHEERAFQENVLGTKIVADLTSTYKGEKFILLSSDKVAYPTSVVGVTKKVAELYVQRIAERSQGGFLIIRFGTVLNSQGTFLEFFKRQLYEGGPITVSHPEARGYFMTAVEAVKLVLQATAMGRSGQIFVLNMGEKVRIVDIAKKLVRLSGLTVGRDIAIEYGGLLPGEKLSEELWEEGEKLVPTRHDKIKRIRSPHTDHHHLEKDIEAMRKMAMRGDRNGLMEKLCDLVPTYQFPDKERRVCCRPSSHPSTSELASTAA